MNELEVFGILQKKIEEALSKTFAEAEIYGVGYLKIQIDKDEIDIQNVKLKSVPEELNNVKHLVDMIKDQ